MNSKDNHRGTNTFGLGKAVLLIALCVTVSTAKAAPQFDLPLDEGTGTTITDSVGGLTGPLGLYLDPIADTAFLSFDNGPAAVVGDHSLQIQGAGYLIANDQTNRVLDITNGPITIESWVYLTAPSPGTTAWEGIARYGGSYKLGMRNRNLAFTLFGKADIFSGKTIPADQWVHVAAVWTPGTGVTFYVDGVPNSIANTNTAGRPVFDNFLTIASEGPSTSTSPRSFPGYMDRVRIHHGALTAGEIDSTAATPQPVHASTLVAYHFDDADLPAQNLATEVLPAVLAQEHLPAWTGPTWTSDSPSGQPNDSALEFTALLTGVISQSATVLDPASTISLNGSNGDYTLEAWIKVPTNTLSNIRRTIFQYQGTPRFALSLNTPLTGDRTLHTTAGTVDQVSTAAVPNDNAWHHVAVVHQDGVEFRFYVDGILSDTRAHTLGAGSDTLPRFTIGSAFNGSLPFIGKMDRLRYSNQALTVEEFDFPASSLPALSINRVNNDLVITWPAAQAGYVLESTTTLPAVAWSTVAHQEIEGQNTAVIPPQGTAKFYRLRQ